MRYQAAMDLNLPPEYFSNALNELRMAETLAQKAEEANDKHPFYSFDFWYKERTLVDDLGDLKVRISRWLKRSPNKAVKAKRNPKNVKNRGLQGEQIDIPF
jgi:hypothetical protein